MKNLLDAVVAYHGSEFSIEKIRLREDGSSHDAKGALLVYGVGSVHSRSKYDHISYFVVDMDRDNSFFKKIIPQMPLMLEPEHVFATYEKQAITTLGRVSTDKGNMPVLRVDNSMGTMSVVLQKRI